MFKFITNDPANSEIGKQIIKKIFIFFISDNFKFKKETIFKCNFCLDINLYYVLLKKLIISLNSLLSILTKYKTSKYKKFWPLLNLIFISI